MHAGAEPPFPGKSSSSNAHHSARRRCAGQAGEARPAERELARLSSEWAQRWGREEDDLKRNRAQLEGQLGFLEDRLRQEKAALKGQLDQLRFNGESEYEAKAAEIAGTLGASAQQLERSLAAPPPPARASAKRASKQEAKAADAAVPGWRELMQATSSRQLPLYELAAPSEGAARMARDLDDFERWYGEWKEVGAQERPPDPGLRARLGSLTRRALGRRNEKKDAWVQATGEREQFRRGVAVKLHEIASSYLRALRQATADVLAEIRAKIDRRVKAQQAGLEQRSGVAALERAVLDVRGLQEARGLQARRVQVNAEETRERLLTAVKGFRAELAQQESLIRQTVRQQQQWEEARRLPTSLTATSRVYPPRGSPDFAKQVAALYPALALGPASAADGPKCDAQGDTQGSGSGGAPRLRPYQQLLSRLLTPESPYRGFLPNFGPGAGKTAATYDVIVGWLDAQLAAGQRLGPPIVVLVPSDKLLGNWAAEARKFVPASKWELAETYTGPNSRILTLRAAGAAGAAAQGKAAQVIVHKMTVALEARPRAAIEAWGEVVRPRGYVLGLYDYGNREMYPTLTDAQRGMLGERLRQQQQLALETNIALPAGGLVVIDEAHNLANASEIARNVVASRTVLAWANLIAQSAGSKLLPLTATLVLDDAKLTDLFKLLNLLQPDPRCKVFEGTWRSSLAADASDAEREAYARADELETRYLVRQLFDGEGRWQDGAKVRLQSCYVGMLFYITLAGDPSVYPALDRGCNDNPASSCSFLWDAATRRPQPLSVADLEAMGLPKPTSGKNLLVRLSAHVNAAVQEGIGKDLQHWNERRRLDYAGPASPSGLNYTDRHSKAAIYNTFGMKQWSDHGATTWPEKAYALQYLLAERPAEKFFVFTTTIGQIFATTVREFFERVAGVQVWDLARLGAFAREHPEARSEADLGRLWIERQTGSGAPAGSTPRRMLLFVRSATATKQFTPEELGRLQDTMMWLYNHASNAQGQLFQAFVGDITTKEGISLLDTPNVVFLEPSPNDTMQIQAEARVLRLCSLRRLPFARWGNVQLWRLIAIAPAAGDAGRRRKRGARRRAGSAGPGAWRVAPDQSLLAAPVAAARSGGGGATAGPTEAALRVSALAVGHDLAALGTPPPRVPRAQAAALRPRLCNRRSPTGPPHAAPPTGARRGGQSRAPAPWQAPPRRRPVAGPLYAPPEPSAPPPAEPGWSHPPAAALLALAPPRAQAAPPAAAVATEEVRQAEARAEMRVAVASGERRTNEEWHYLYLAAKRPASALILQALKEADIGCYLYKGYNADPTVSLCFGQQPSAAEDRAGASRLPRSDRYCSRSSYLLLQDEDDALLTEFDANGGVNGEGLWEADSFQRRCSLGLAPIVELGEPGYRDLLILTALTAPSAGSAAGALAELGLAGDELVVREILASLAKGATPTAEQVARPWSLSQELRLWILAAALENPDARAALRRFLEHRVDRRSTEEERGRWRGIVDQISRWMRLRFRLDRAAEELARFYRAPPTLLAAANR
jgi:Type III restriction enzyme, res subunit